MFCEHTLSPDNNAYNEVRTYLMYYGYIVVVEIHSNVDGLHKENFLFRVYYKNHTAYSIKHTQHASDHVEGIWCSSHLYGENYTQNGKSHSIMYVTIALLFIHISVESVSSHLLRTTRWMFSHKREIEGKKKSNYTSHVHNTWIIWQYMPQGKKNQLQLYSFIWAPMCSPCVWLELDWLIRGGKICNNLLRQVWMSHSKLYCKDQRIWIWMRSQLPCGTVLDVVTILVCIW